MLCNKLRQRHTRAHAEYHVIHRDLKTDSWFMCALYIVKDGRYAAAYRKLRQTGFKLSWMDRLGYVAGAKPKQTRHKFSCPKCGLNAWAKPDAKLLCGTCQKAMRS